MRIYCTQNNGKCQTCSLVNYGMDCMNNPIKQYKGLTPTEIIITEYIKQAKRNKEIADIMGIGEGTVRTHLRSIFRKLKIKSRAELIIREL